MAVKKTNDIFTLPKDTMIEVISIKGQTVVKTKMSYENALKIRKKRGWTNILYQSGFSQFPDNSKGAG